MRALLLFLLLSFDAHAIIARDANGKISRSAALIKSFRAANPCPGTGKIQKTCPGYVIDHILPLCGYGTDTMDNLQWQSVTAAKAKDKLEIRQCKAIKLATGICR